MHCPGCGMEASVTQKFCRSCGFNLEKVPLLVAEQLSESGELLTRDLAEKLQERQRKIEALLSKAGLGFTALVVLSLLSGLIYLIVAGNMPLVPGVVLLTLVLSGIVAGSLALYSENLKKTLSKGSTKKSRQLPEKEITTKLPLDTYEAPLISVTERTTNLLGKDNAVDTRNDQRKNDPMIK